MRLSRVRLPVPVLLGAFVAVTASLAQTNSPSPRQVSKPAGADPPFETGSVTNGIYHHRVFGVSCKIPPGWVLRTEEMNARDENEPVDTEAVDPQKASPALTKADEK